MSQSAKRRGRRRAPHRPPGAEKILSRQRAMWDTVDFMPPYEHLRRECDRLTPNRAHATLRYIDMLEQHQPGARDTPDGPVLNYPPSAFNQGAVRARGGRERMGNPARAAQRERDRMLSQIPDEHTKEAKRLTKRLTEIWQGGVGDGPAIGSFRLAAEHYAPTLQVAYGLTGDDHRHAIVEWLVGCWGEIVHAFPQTPELPSYPEWRDRLKGAGL